jgi:hypothetical protein
MLQKSECDGDDKDGAVSVDDECLRTHLIATMHTAKNIMTFDLVSKMKGETDAVTSMDTEVA